MCVPTACGVGFVSKHNETSVFTGEQHFVVAVNASTSSDIDPASGRMVGNGAMSVLGPHSTTLAATIPDLA